MDGFSFFRLNLISQVQVIGMHDHCDVYLVTLTANAEPAEVVADVEEPLAPASNESVAVPTVSPPVSATISPPLAPNVVTKSAPRASMRVQTLPLTFPNTAPPVSAPSTSVLAELAAMVMSPDRPSTSAGWSDVESPVKLKSRGGSDQRSVMVRAARANATKVDDTLTVGLS